VKWGFFQTHISITPNKTKQWRYFLFTSSKMQHHTSIFLTIAQHNSMSWYSVSLLQTNFTSIRASSIIYTQPKITCNVLKSKATLEMSNKLKHSIQFSLSYIAQYHKLRICTHTTSLSHVLTSDQENLPRNRRRKNFSRRKKKVTFRRATEEDPSHRMDKSKRCHVYRMKHYRVT